MAGCLASRSGQDASSAPRTHPVASRPGPGRDRSALQPDPQRSDRLESVADGGRQIVRAHSRPRAGRETVGAPRPAQPARQHQGCRPRRRHGRFRPHVRCGSPPLRQSPGRQVTQGVRRGPLLPAHHRLVREDQVPLVVRFHRRQHDQDRRPLVGGRQRRFTHPRVRCRGRCWTGNAAFGQASVYVTDRAERCAGRSALRPRCTAGTLPGFRRSPMNGSPS